MEKLKLKGYSVKYLKNLFMQDGGSERSISTGQSKKTHI